MIEFCPTCIEKTLLCHYYFTQWMLHVVGRSCEKWNLRIPGPWQPGQTGSGQSTYLLGPWFPLLRERSWQSWPLAALTGAPTTGSGVVFSVVIEASIPINAGSTATSGVPALSPAPSALVQMSSGLCFFHWNLVIGFRSASWLDYGSTDLQLDTSTEKTKFN
jgi:hypothetical protein